MLVVLERSSGSKRSNSSKRFNGGEWTEPRALTEQAAPVERFGALFERAQLIQCG